jgi:hypothetical protein
MRWMPHTNDAQSARLKKDLMKTTRSPNCMAGIKQRVVHEFDLHQCSGGFSPAASVGRSNNVR